MQLNPYIFLLPKPPRLFIWNYKTHEQFEVDSSHAGRLIELEHRIRHPSSTSLRPHLSDRGPVTSCAKEKTNVNKLTENAISTIDVLNSNARAGKEGSRMLRGKKLINEILVIRMNREIF
ncbi:hypothetical protein D3C80_1576080 [compost metagenome]